MNIFSTITKAVLIAVGFVVISAHTASALEEFKTARQLINQHGYQLYKVQITGTPLPTTVAGFPATQAAVVILQRLSPNASLPVNTSITLRAAGGNNAAEAINRIDAFGSVGNEAFVAIKQVAVGIYHAYGIGTAVGKVVNGYSAVPDSNSIFPNGAPVVFTNTGGADVGDVEIEELEPPTGEPHGILK